MTRTPTRADVRAIWQRWLGTQAILFVVEDLQRPAHEALVCFVASVFVRASFLREGVPCAQKVYEMANTPNSPVLSLAEIRSANARQELHLWLLHFAVRECDPVRARHALALVNAGLSFFHDGYGLRSLHLETADPALAAQARAGGLLQRPGLPSLYGVTRDELTPGVASALPSLFCPRSPRFGLTPSQQQVLTYTLLGNSDSETAEELGVSPDAIKQAWRGIHQRVERVAPHLVERRAEKNGVRGGERRRRLIEYLRHHMEELRPVARTTTLARHRQSACG